MRLSNRRCSWVRLGCSLLAVCCTTTVGCETRRDDEFQVSGEVRFAGEPVPAGYILFNPSVKDGTDGLQGYAEIEAGHYSTSGSQKGVTGGTYRVKLYGFEKGSTPKQLFEPYEITVEFSPDRETLDFEVPASARTEKAEALPPT